MCYVHLEWNKPSVTTWGFTRNLNVPKGSIPKKVEKFWPVEFCGYFYKSLDGETRHIHVENVDMRKENELKNIKW